MAENLVSTGCNDDNTYPQTLMGVIETALAPMMAFKEILLDAGDDNGPVKLTDVGVVTVLAATVQDSRIVPEVQKVAHHG